ncbi:MAG: hypothetical protein Q7R33_07920 [Nitrosarchaeum sp.]|nr:hypothetical protein [Nitrosarchaeum sp.]
MITRVAIKIKDKVYVGQEKERHDVVMMAHLEEGKMISGFVTDTGEFLDRKHAAKHAFECGQIKDDANCLISEDLW